MKGALVGALVIAALALQTSPFFGRNGAGIDLVLVVVVWAALQFGPASGLLTGAAAGLAQDVLSAGTIGVGGVAKTLVGFGAGVVGSQFIVANAMTRFVVLAVGAALNELVFLGLYAVIERRGFDMPWRQAGARALATAVVGIALMVASNAIPAFLMRRRLRRGY
ncbi:MAG: rod shape-determining protein MreD [Vicinamibacteraceae bacterium]